MTELKQRPGDQPLPTPNNRRDIQSLVMDDIAARRAVGIGRYGTALQAFNGRDALRDLYEELLDACTYIRQVIEERDSPPRAADRAELEQQIREAIAKEIEEVIILPGRDMSPAEAMDEAYTTAAKIARGEQ